MASADVFTVLSEAIRRDILYCLRAQERSVSEIVELVPASQPTVSKHLKVLREAGLVRQRVAGQRRFYRYESAGLAPAREWLDAMMAHPQGAATTESEQSVLSKGMGRAATRAADLWANLPRFGRRH